MRTTVVSVAIGTALLALGSTSVAAPDRTVQISRHSPSVTWTSEIGAGTYAASPVVWDRTRCAEPVFDCDITLLDISSGGDVELSATEGDPFIHGDLHRLEIRIYRSDDSGAKGAEIPTEHLGPGRERARSLPAGRYVIEVAWAEGVGDYTGTATLKPATRARRT